MSLPCFSTNIDSIKGIGIANQIVITAIISPTKTKKPTVKQAAPILIQTQIANSSQYSFLLAILC